MPQAGIHWLEPPAPGKRIELPAPWMVTGQDSKRMFSRIRLLAVEGRVFGPQPVLMATSVFLKVLSMRVTEPTLSLLVSELMSDMSMPMPQLLISRPA
jgi:hypothetical protein